MNSPSTQFTENDLTITPGNLVQGLSGVMVKTRRGPIGAVSIAISTWEQFKNLYGGFTPSGDNSGIQQIKRALESGSALRVSRLMHYTDPSDPETYDAEFAAQGATNTFTISADIVTGQSITYGNGVYTVIQAFEVNTTNTLKLLVAQIMATFPAVLEAKQISNRVFQVVPKDAAITNDTAGFVGSGTLPTVTRTTTNAFKNSAGTTLFSFSPKYPGADYNNIKISTKAPSNGQYGYWDLVIEFLGESALTETYKNIKIPGAPTAEASNYLAEVVKNSKLVNVTYSNLSAVTSLPIIPVVYTIKMMGGTDGSAITDSDIIGDSAGKTGFYVFDGVDDVSQIAVITNTADLPSAAVHNAGASYADARKDLQYFGYVEGLTEAAVIAEKEAYNVDTSYAMFFADGGGIKVVNPENSQETTIPAMGDILGKATYSEKNFGAWYSFAGYQRGVITNTLGAVNQWGSPGNQVNLDLLANYQVNVVINRSKRTLLWGCFTGQLTNSQLSLANVRRLHIFLKKTLGPILEYYLEEPNDMETWKKAYLAGKPLLDSLVTNRAIYSYRWEGDQFANSLDDLKINAPADIQAGKYKVRLFLKDISAMQEFSINLVATPIGVSFEDAIDIVQP